MQYELSNEEKQLVIDNRLENLSLDINRSGTTLKAYNLGDDLQIALYDEVDKTSKNIVITDEDADKLFKFLKQRYELRKELISLCKSEEEDKKKPF